MTFSTLPLPSNLQLILPAARTLLAATIVLISHTVSAEVGEFSIPSAPPLTPPQLSELRRLVNEDPEARLLADAARETALPLLQALPHPLEVIHYEGLVNTDHRRIATVERLREMADVALLLRHWQASGDERAATTLRRFIVEWAGAYRLTGNDVNENKFYPLLVAYHWENPRGGSLRKSVNHVVPYALGEKTRQEWVNSQVDLDRRRAAAGLDKYQAGSLYDPRSALELMQQASFFDPDLARVVRHLTGSSAKRFPSWQSLVNAVARD